MGQLAHALAIVGAWCFVIFVSVLTAVAILAGGFAMVRIWKGPPKG